MMNYDEILTTLLVWELTKYALKRIWKVFSNVTNQNKDE
jgi:hypothetical protein